MKVERILTRLMLAIGLANLAILYSFSTGTFKYPDDRKFVYELIAANVVWIAFGAWPSYKTRHRAVRTLWLVIGMMLIFQTLFTLGSSQGG